MAMITDESQIESTEALPQTDPKDAKPSSRRYATCFVMILVISTLLLAVYTHLQTKKAYEQQQQQNDVINQQMMVLKKYASQTDEALTALRTKVKQSTFTAQTSIDELNQRLQNALQQRFYQNQDWLLLKARYYLELAQINNHWAHNTNTTILLLQQADQLLKESYNQSQLFATRQAIAKEIIALKAKPTLDIAGLLSQFDALQAVITQLPTKNTLRLLKTPPSTTNQENLTTWRARLQQSMSFLKKFVVIRRNNDIQPTFSLEHDTMIRDKLGMNLQIAQWAIIQNNPIVYKNTLIQALQTINANIDKKAASTNALITQLKELQALDFNPQSIVINESLTLLNQVIDKPAETANTPESPGEIQ